MVSVFAGKIWHHISPNFQNKHFKQDQILYGYKLILNKHETGTLIRWPYRGNFSYLERLNNQEICFLNFLFLSSDFVKTTITKYQNPLPYIVNYIYIERDFGDIGRRNSATSNTCSINFGDSQTAHGTKIFQRRFLSLDVLNLYYKRG